MEGMLPSWTIVKFLYYCGSMEDQDVAAWMVRLIVVALGVMGNRTHVTPRLSLLLSVRVIGNYPCLLVSHCVLIHSFTSLHYAGLFLEHGPLRLDTTSQDEWTMRIHKQSWHTAPAYVVYVDQPVGTGLSFTTSGDYPTNDEQVNRDFHHWLQEFLLLHADAFLNDEKTALKRPLYFSGESHAGHYIPSMMNYIHQQNDAKLKIRVSGAAIGNGWTDPYHQYAGAEAAYGHGLIDLAQKNALDEREKDCQAQITSGNYHYSGCLGLLDDIVAQSEGKTGQYRISQYDARNWERKHAARTFPPGHKRVESYLGGWQTPNDDPSMNVVEQVLEAIHATPSHEAGQRYQECTDPPYNALAHQDGLGVVDDVVALLEDDVKLLFFNGLEDLICNHVGNEVMLMKLPWKHRDHWIESKRYSWTAAKETEVSGYVKEFENLTFLKVLHSGHMVPMDVPNVALDMMRIFMYGKSFESAVQDLGRSQDEATADCPACPACPQEPARTAVNSSDATAKTPGSQDDDSNSVMRYVVEHSWIGAVLAVSVFLGAFLYVRRRQRVPAVATTYGNLEMKEGTRYTDRPEGSSFDEDDESETNGNGII